MSASPGAQAPSGLCAKPFLRLNRLNWNEKLSGSGLDSPTMRLQSSFTPLLLAADVVRFMTFTH